MLAGKVKRGCSITTDCDKTLDLDAFRDKFEKAVRDSAATTRYSQEEVGRALRMAIDAHVPPLREAINNVEDEVLTIRQSEIDQLVDIRDIGNLRMFDIEGNEL